MRIEKGGRAIVSVEDWRTLAPPKRDHHWADGRSAKELARAWCGAGEPAVPVVLRDLLDSRPETRNLRVDVVHPEHPIVFDGFGGEPRNADLALVGEGLAGRVAVTVEAKADEPFGPTVTKAMADALERAVENPRSRGTERVVGLARALFKTAEKGQPPVSDLRYQLLSGLAGSLAYAAQLGAPWAVFIVHEFVTDQTKDDRHAANARDLEAFLTRLGVAAPAVCSRSSLFGPLSVPGSHRIPNNVTVLLGKVTTHLRRDGQTSRV